jgi:hypothetical protein
MGYLEFVWTLASEEKMPLCCRVLCLKISQIATAAEVNLG